MSASEHRVRVGVDVGGTFTDVVLRDDDGRVRVRKLLSTPPAYDSAVVEAVSDLARDATPVGAVVHGTTVATNAVLERRGAATALLTTRGFRDVLELRRLRIPLMYDPFWRKPPPLIARRLRFEVDERLAADGTVLRALDETGIRLIAAELRTARIEAVAVCLLHSYRNPDHERRVGALLAEELPGLTVSLSSDILREQREYERTATTVVNAYVRPLMGRYIAAIRAGLDAAGITAPLTLMQSSGGAMTSDDAVLRPVLALESGPAAGVVAALAIVNRLGISDAIAFDMGGTTAKASLIEAGDVSHGREYEVGGSVSAGSRLLRGAGELLRIPTIDIAEVGAGGGSVAWLDPAGGLQVGPRSAGADPGPACYGRGGVEPTVTDANVALGYMPSGRVADGEITIDRTRAEDALGRVAEPLGLTMPEAAGGIHAIANARMMRALRSVSSERGRDPRAFALVAYGGAGPVHAAGLAEGLGCRLVVVPPLPGLFSATGLLFARPEFHDVESCHLDARAVAASEVEAGFRLLEERLAPQLPGLPLEWVRSADLRYGGQTWEVEVVAPPGAVDDQALALLVARFEAEHERLYGVRDEEGAPIEIRALRALARGPAGPAEVRVDAPTPVRAPTRTASFAGTPADVPVRARASISLDSEDGPLLIDEYDTTVVVPPGWTVRRDAATGCLLLERP